MRKLVRAFTLIELLIVVAIIAILAAIAVPNFLEAQVRSKVSRVLSDMRNIKTGLESYLVDHNRYPETDLGPGPDLLNPRTFGRGLTRLTTPIAYLTSVFSSPFEERKIGFDPALGPKYTNNLNAYLYVSAKVTRDNSGNVAPSGADGGSGSVPGNDGFDDSYQGDRLVYIFGNPSPSPALFARLREGQYEIKSVGPDSIDNRDESNALVTNQFEARIYDPTNGTQSAGDIVTFQDTSIKAEQKGI